MASPELEVMMIAEMLMMTESPLLLSYRVTGTMRFSSLGLTCMTDNQLWIGEWWPITKQILFKPFLFEQKYLENMYWLQGGLSTLYFDPQSDKCINHVRYE